MAGPTRKPVSFFELLDWVASADCERMPKLCGRCLPCRAKTEGEWKRAKEEHAAIMREVRRRRTKARLAREGG